MAYKRGSHYGSFAKGFIQAFLQAQRLRMMREYYESRIEDARIADLNLGYDRNTGKYWNPTSRKFDGDQYQGPPDWKSQAAQDAAARGRTDAGGIGGERTIGNFWTPEVMKHAADRLVNEAGLSQQGASGLVARWAAIEAGNGPSDISADGKAVGINQARGDRQPEGYRSWSLDQQLDYIINTDLKAPGQAKALEVLRNAKTSEDGARGASMYERAEGYDEKTGNDNFTARTPVDKVYNTVYGDGKAPATTAATTTTTPIKDTGTGSGKVTTGGVPVDAKGRPVRIDPDTGRAIDPDTDKPVANAPAKSVQADTQRPYETAGLDWGGPPSYDQAERLKRWQAGPEGPRVDYKAPETYDVRTLRDSPELTSAPGQRLADPERIGENIYGRPGPIYPVRAAPTPPITAGPMGPSPPRTAPDLPTPPITAGPMREPNVIGGGPPYPVPDPLRSADRGPPYPPPNVLPPAPYQPFESGFPTDEPASAPIGIFPARTSPPAVSTGRTGPAEINVPLAGGATDERRQPASVARQAIPPRPGLTYYAPTTGNARQPQPMQYQDPNDPRIYRGPGAVVPTAPPAPVARAPTPTLAVTAPQPTSTPASTADITPRPLPDTVPLPPVRPTVTSANDTGPSTGPPTQTAYAIPPTPGRDYDDDFAMRAMDRDIDQGFLDMTQASRKGGQVRRPFIALELGGNPGSTAGDTGGGASSNWGGAGGRYSYSDAGFTSRSSTPLDPSKAIVYGQTAGAGSVSPGQWLANQSTSTMFTPAQWAAGNYTAQNMMDAFNALPSDQQKYYNDALGLWRGITSTPGGNAGKQALQYDLSNLTPSAATPAATTPAATTPAATTPAPAQPVVTVTNAQTAQTQPGAYNPPNTTVKGNAFTGNPVNYGQGTNYFGPNYNAGSFNQDTLPGAATPTTNLLDDGGGVSAAPLGMLPGMGGGQQQIPPVYFNPQIYAQAGAPINRGVSANTIPSFAAMAVPTYAARKGGGIPSPRSLSRVMRYAGGGDVDLSDPEGDEMEQQMMYDDRMSAPVSAPVRDTSSQEAALLQQPNEEVYAPDTAPTAQAQPVSYMHPSAGGNFVIPGGTGGMGGPRMSVGAGPRVGIPRGAGKASTDIAPAGAEAEDIDFSTPSVAQPSSTPPAVNDNGDLSPNFLSVLAMGIKNIIGLTQPGAKVPPNSQVAQNRSEVATSNLTDEDHQAAQLLGHHLDQSQSFDNVLRNVNGLNELANYYLVNGEDEKAAHATSAMLMYLSKMSAKYGEEGVRRYYNGDMQGALDALSHAKDFSPDGTRIKGTWDASKGTADVQLTNYKDVVKWEGEVLPQQILAVATNTANRSMFWHAVQSQAAQAGNVGAKEGLTREAQEEGESAIGATGANQPLQPVQGGQGGQGGPPTAIPVQGERPPSPVVDTTPESTAPKPTPAMVQQFNRPPIGETPAPNIGPTPTSTLPSPLASDVAMERVNAQEQAAERTYVTDIRAKYQTPSGNIIWNGQEYARPTPPDVSGLTASQRKDAYARWKVNQLDPYNAMVDANNHNMATELAAAKTANSQKFNAIRLAVTEKFSQGQQTERMREQEKLQTGREQFSQDEQNRRAALDVAARALATKTAEEHAARAPRPDQDVNHTFALQPDETTGQTTGKRPENYYYGIFGRMPNGTVDATQGKAAFDKAFPKMNQQSSLNNALINGWRYTHDITPEIAADAISGIANGAYNFDAKPVEADGYGDRVAIVATRPSDGSQVPVILPREDWNNVKGIRQENKLQAGAKALEEAIGSSRPEAAPAPPMATRFRAPPPVPMIQNIPGRPAHAIPPQPTLQ